MPAKWLRVTVTSPSAELAPLIAEGLIACGGSAVEERDAELATYLPLDDDPASLLDRVRDVVRGAAGSDVTIAAEAVPDQDWLVHWRAGLGARRVGERIIVAPSWVPAEAGPDDLLIRIDPQMAFGTGEHASTRGVLRLMQRLDFAGAVVLDVGAGSAILAIAAARLGARTVFAVESDPDAIDNARGNVVANDVADRVGVKLAHVDDAFLAGHGSDAFDCILANVLSSVLRPLLPAFHAALRAGGTAILSGILLEEAPLMRDAASVFGFAIEAEDVEGQWWSVLLRRS